MNYLAKGKNFFSVHGRRKKSFAELPVSQVPPFPPEFAVSEKITFRVKLNEND